MGEKEGGVGNQYFDRKWQEFKCTDYFSLFMTEYDTCDILNVLTEE